jgi:hypothetical protein
MLASPEIDVNQKKPGSVTPGPNTVPIRGERERTAYDRGIPSSVDAVSVAP